MKTNRDVFFFCLLFCLAFVPLQLVGQEVTVDTRLVNERLEVFFLNNFDINSPSAGIPFFFLDVTNQTSSNVRVMLRMRVNTEDLGELLEAETVELARQMLAERQIGAVDYVHHRDPVCQPQRREAIRYVLPKLPISYRN